MEHDMTKEVAGAVKEALAPFQEELKAVSGTVEEVQKELDGLESRGDVKPNDEKVKELEKRLDEANENIRLIHTDKAGLGKPGAEKKDAFEGFMFADKEALIKGLKDGKGINQRTVDSGAFATGGQLNPEQQQAFIDFASQEQAMLGFAEWRPMASDKADIDVIGVDGRKMRKATEGTAPTGGAGVSTSKRTLSVVETILPEDITLTFLEDNIERLNAETHIASLIMNSFGNDLNDLGVNGKEDLAATITDTTPADGFDDTTGLSQNDHDFLRTNDGWFEIVDAAITGATGGHDVDLAGVTDPIEVLAAICKALPSKFRTLNDLGIIVPVNFAEAYANAIAARETAEGDRALQNGFTGLRYFGRNLIAESKLVGLNADKIMFTPGNNLVYGTRRNTTLDAEVNFRKRLVEYTLTSRTDYEFKTLDAVVRGKSLDASLR